MNKTTIIKNVMLSLAITSLIGLGAGGVALGIVNKNNVIAAANPTKHPIKVFSTNDIHGRLLTNDFQQSAGIRSLAGYLNQQDYDLLLDGGDMIQGQALNDTDKGKTTAKIAASMEYDGIAVGNHEFDFGLANIQEISNMPGVNFLSANTRFKNNNERVFNPSRIVTLDNGVKAGIIGLTTLDTAVKTHPNNVKDVKFTSLVEETQQQINELETQGINLIIVVSHVGAVRNDLTGSTIQLAEALPGKIDLIVDGHTQVDYNVPVITPQGVTQIIQTGEYTQSVRETDFNYDELTGKITNFKSVQIPFKDIVGYDALSGGTINQDISDLEKLEGTINSVQIIDNAPVVTSNDFARIIERPMPNMVADANLAAANSVQDVNIHADLAIMNTGGVRVSMPSGSLLRRDIFNVLPFGNQLRIVEMPGSVLQQVMEYSITQQASGAFLSISSSTKINVTATLRENTADENINNEPQKIDQTKPIDVGVQIKNSEGVFVNIDPKKIYKVALNDFLLAGGDGYSMLDLGEPTVIESGVKVIAEQGDMLLTLINFVETLGSTQEGVQLWTSTYESTIAPQRIIITERA